MLKYIILMCICHRSAEIQEIGNFNNIDNCLELHNSKENDTLDQTPYMHELGENFNELDEFDCEKNTNEIVDITDIQNFDFNDLFLPSNEPNLNEEILSIDKSYSSKNECPIKGDSKVANSFQLGTKSDIKEKNTKKCDCYKNIPEHLILYPIPFVKLTQTNSKKLIKYKDQDIILEMPIQTDEIIGDINPNTLDISITPDCRSITFSKDNDKALNENKKKSFNEKFGKRKNVDFESLYTNTLHNGFNNVQQNLKRKRLEMKNDINSQISSIKMKKLDKNVCLSNNFLFLQQFQRFIEEIEVRFYDFLKEYLKQENFTIYQVLYSCEFIILDTFDQSLFSKYFKTNLDVSKGLSTTYQGLCFFLDKIELFGNIINILINCVDKNLKENDVQGIGKKLKSLFIKFLKSSESIYIFRFLPQLKSYLTNVVELELEYNENIIKGFIVFIIILKRNSYYQANFPNEKFKKQSGKNIEKIFTCEVLQNNVLLMVFLKNWPIKEKHNILYNLSTIIEVNCFLLGNQISKFNRTPYTIILISEFLFFELMKLEIFSTIKKYLNSGGLYYYSLDCIINNSKNNLQIIEIINKHKILFFEEINKTPMIFFSVALNKKINTAIETPNKLNLTEFSKLLIIFNRYNHFHFPSKNTFINYLLHNFREK